MLDSVFDDKWGISPFGGGGNWWDAYDGSPVLILSLDQNLYFNDGAAKAYTDLITNSTAGAKPTWDSAGDILPIAANLPRPAYDPETLALLGHVMEPALSRISPYYQATEARDTVSGATTTNLSLNTLGVFSGLKVASNGADWHGTKIVGAYDTPLTLGNDYAFDIVIQHGDTPTASLGWYTYDGGNSANDLTYTFSTASVVAGATPSGAFSNLSTLALPDGITHIISGVFTPTVSLDFGVRIGPQSATSGAYVNLLGWFFYGASEKLPHTPITGSDGSTVSIVADTQYLTDGASLPYTGYNQAQITGKITATPLDDASRDIISFNDGTANEVIEVVIDVSGNVVLNVVDGGVSQCSIDSGVNAVIGTELIIAFRAGASDFAISVNGGVEQTFTASGTMPTVTKSDLGGACIMKEAVCYDALIADLNEMSV